MADDALNPAGTPAPSVAPQQRTFLKPRVNEEALDDTILQTQLAAYKKNIDIKTTEYEKQLTTEAEARLQADKKKHQDAYAKGQAQPTPEELEALNQRKNAATRTYTMGGIAAGALVGLMIMSNPPAMLAAGIASVAGLFTAGATPVAALAIAANVSAVVGTVITAGLAFAGYNAGSAISGYTNAGMKPDIGGRSFELSEDDKKNIKAQAGDRAKIYAADLLVADIQNSILTKDPNYSPEKTEVMLKALTNKLRVDSDLQIPRSAIEIIDNLRGEIGADLDKKHAKTEYEKGEASSKPKTSKVAKAEEDLQLAALKAKKEQLEKGVGDADTTKRLDGVETTIAEMAKGMGQLAQQFELMIKLRGGRG